MTTDNTIGGGPPSSYTSIKNLTGAKSGRAGSSSQSGLQDSRAGSPPSGSPAQIRNEKALAKWQERLSGLRTVEGTRRLKVPKQVTKSKGRTAWAKIVLRVAGGLFSKTLEIGRSEDRIIVSANKARSNYEITTKGKEYKELTNDQKQDVKELHDAKMDILKRKLTATQKGYESLGNKAVSLTTFNMFGHELGSGWSVRAQVRKMDRTMRRLPEAVARHVSDKLDAEDFKKAEFGTPYPGRDGKRLPLLSFPKSLGFTSSDSGFFNRKSTRLREQCRALVVSVLLTQGADKALEVKQALMTIASTKGNLDKEVDAFWSGEVLVDGVDKGKTKREDLTVVQTKGGLDKEIDGFFGVLQDAKSPQHLAGLAHKIIQAGKTVSAFIK